MPYKIEQRGSQFCVVKQDGSKTFGCHASEKKARRQLAALYANESRHMESDMNEFRFVNLLGATSKPRRETLNGREHLVVPVVALVEGVVRAMNSKQHELVRAEKFQSAPAAWNGRPLFAGHPVEKGVPISGNDPRISERSFGSVFNTTTDEKRLLMEAWIDIEKANSMPEAKKVLDRCLAHERGDADARPIEVSTGSLVGVKKLSGVYNGKSYANEWDVILPDHLAMLAEDKVGACSVAMGCGALRAMAIEEGGGLRMLEGEQEITMAIQDMQSLDVSSPEFLRLLRDIPAQERSGAKDADFAGPNRSFPILAPGDVSAAASALGRAKGDRDAIKRSIVKIAKRKGWEAQLPDAWKPQPKNMMARVVEKAREMLRLAQTPDDMTDANLRTKLYDALDDVDPEFTSVEAFWPINDPSHVVYTCQSPSDVQPDPLPYPGYVGYDYDLYERPFTIDDAGIVTLGAARIEVVPVTRYEPSEGAAPESDVRYMAAELYALAGKRHSSADEGMLQKVHDYSVDLGASCASSRNLAAHECSCRNRNLTQGEGTMDRTKTIAALAAHPHSAIKDPKLLEKFDDVALKSLEDNAAATEATVKAAKDAQAESEIKLKAAQDALAAPVAEERLPAEYRDLMAERKASDAKETGELVMTLKAAQSAYTEDELKAKPLPELRKMASMLKVEKPSFTGKPVPRLAAEGKSYAPPDPFKAGLDKMAAGR